MEDGITKHGISTPAARPTHLQSRGKKWGESEVGKGENSLDRTKSGPNSRSKQRYELYPLRSNLSAAQLRHASRVKPFLTSASYRRKRPPHVHTVRAVTYRKFAFASPTCRAVTCVSRPKARIAAYPILSGIPDSVADASGTAGRFALGR